MWTEVAGGRWSEGRNGAALWTRVFWADAGQGRDKATENEYEKGDEIEVLDFVLTLETIDVAENEGYDVVTITYTTPEGWIRNPSERYQDGVVRNENDEEWHMELELEEVRAEDAIAYDGSEWSGTWGIDADKPVDQPVCFLVQRKWLDKNAAVPGENITTLPQTRTKALEMVKSYLPNAAAADKKYENDPPLLMSLLAGANNKFMCVSVTTEKDNDLVLRTARFKYKPDGWNTNVYGPAWPA